MSSFRDRLAKHHDTLDMIVPDIVASLREMLTDKDPKVRVKAIEIWGKVKDKAYNYEADAVRLVEKQIDRALTHLERRTGTAEGAMGVDDPLAKALREG